MNKCKGPKEDYPTIWRDSKEMSMAGVRRTIWDEVGSVDHGRFCWSLKGLGFYSAVRRETIGSWLVVFFISLMTKDVEDFLMCLFDIWTSLVNVYSYLAYFLIWLFSYYSVLEVFFIYILDTSLFSNTCFANIFCKSTLCLFILLISWREDILNFDVQFIHFLSFMDCAIDVISKKSFLTQSHKDFLLCFLLDTLVYVMLYL